MVLNQQTLQLMEELTSLIGVSGSETEVAQCLAHYYENYGASLCRDHLGSLYGLKKSNQAKALKVMISANLDEIGFMVQGLMAEGYAKLLPLGDISAAEGQTLRVQCVSNEGEVIQGNAYYTQKQWYGDFGGAQKSDLEALNIEPGNKVALAGAFEVLSNGKRLISKAWRNRLGCVLGIELLKAFQHQDLPFDLYIGGTAQREVGLRGAETATELIQPDLAIVIDCMPVETLSGTYPCQLGQGLLLQFYDKSMMPNRGLLQSFRGHCQNEHIAYQHYYSMEETDAKWIHKRIIGCPTLVLAVGGRYIHSGNELIDSQDYSSLYEALKGWLENQNQETIQAYKTSNR